MPPDTNKRRKVKDKALARVSRSAPRFWSRSLAEDYQLAVLSPWQQYQRDIQDRRAERVFNTVAVLLLAKPQLPPTTTAPLPPMTTAPLPLMTTAPLPWNRPCTRHLRRYLTGRVLRSARFGLLCRTHRPRLRLRQQNIPPLLHQLLLARFETPGMVSGPTPPCVVSGAGPDTSGPVHTLLATRLLRKPNSRSANPPSLVCPTLGPSQRGHVRHRRLGVFELLENPEFSNP
ncbi:unnamed protein product [Rhizoctonia solani]|uniref:Uncharacterized protein n=1 Tax=Rhizoctonia solani TaxID=456999 RepID=A0A8H3HET2_9AGAM|nr:unnamed protein product [Rhizoctonia solani]